MLHDNLVQSQLLWASNQLVQNVIFPVSRPRLRRSSGVAGGIATKPLPRHTGRARHQHRQAQPLHACSICISRTPWQSTWSFENTQCIARLEVPCAADGMIRMRHKGNGQLGFLTSARQVPACSSKLHGHGMRGQVLACRGCGSKVDCAAAGIKCIGDFPLRHC